MTFIHPVILSGGSGSRLWPLSREAYPKQLLALCGTQTMLQATLKRAQALASSQLQVAAPVLVCNQEHRFLVREQSQQIGISPAAIYLEPAGRNTAPAIALAALHLSEQDPDVVMLVMPADHFIRNEAAFAAAVAIASKAALAGKLVTFGIKPAYAETGYGYIRAGAEDCGVPGVLSVAEFVEKPSREKAEGYLAAGNYSWNSGMFLFKANRYLEELGKFKPDILKQVRLAFSLRNDDIGFTRPDAQAFLQSPADSIDYAVMQTTTDAAVIPVDIGWSDVGSWESLWQLGQRDANHNVISGDVCALNTRNSYLRADSRQLSVVGLDNVTVVETKDAVLVMNTAASQDVKKVVEQLKAQGRSEGMTHVRVHRPWGWYEELDQGPGFKVKRLQVKPGEKLSLQLHHQRAEHWVVVTGIARVTVDDREFDMAVNQSTYIPVGAKHRLENRHSEPLQLIEVQSGGYLGEDDIVRFEDKYQRLG